MVVDRQMFELPSVLTLFVEWDESTKSFSTKETFDIIGVIETARYAAAPTCIALVQHSPTNKSLTPHADIPELFDNVR
jgi:hypothetical protein